MKLFSEDQLEFLVSGMVTVVGVPFDEHSSFMKGPAMAPPRIREVLHSGSTTLSAEDGTDLSMESRFYDLGDLQLSENPFETIENAITTLLDHGTHILSLGGDHIITYPILKAYTRKYPDLTVVQLDAHPDLYEELDGDRFSHACPFARIMEEALVKRLIQVGIRTLNKHQREQAKRFDVEIFEMKEYTPVLDIALDGPVYLSLDMDVLDPAFAPGVSHHEPGGLSTRDLLRTIHSIDAQIVGADIVEFNPKRDPLGITAMAAAKLLKEIAAAMLE
ncbi:MAG: agmatinase [Euryarchaeota archaeon]|nr:agmatinase [Euryarchaeota archaeon]